jgi:hypothetical protein
MSPASFWTLLGILLPVSVWIIWCGVFRGVTPVRFSSFVRRDEEPFWFWLTFLINLFGAAVGLTISWSMFAGCYAPSAAIFARTCFLR